MIGKIKFGIIGYGVQGKTYASILTGKSLPGIGVIPKPENCMLTSVSDINPDISKAFEDDSSITTYTDWKVMIDAQICDAIIVTVPHFLHAEITIYGLEHGVHVLCEKPAAVRASDVEAMIEAANRNPELAFGLMLNQRTNTIYSSIKELIDSGKIGDIRRSNWIINSWWRPDSYYQSSEWRGTWSGEGGGLLVNQAPHQLDLWTWLCGKPSSVYAICREGAHRDISVENDVTLVTEYDKGATGTFISCTHDPLGSDRLEIDLSKGKIIVENSQKASIYYFAEDEKTWNESMDFRQFMQKSRTNPESLYTMETLTSNTGFGQDYVSIFTNFAGHILDGRPLLAPGSDGLVPVQLANTAQLSGHLGQSLSFPCDSSAYNQYLEERIQSEKRISRSVPIKNIGHVSLNVKDMSAMLHFYCHILGMEHLFTSTYWELLKSMNTEQEDTSIEQNPRYKMIAEKGSEPWVEYLKLADRQYLELFHNNGMHKEESPNPKDYYGYMKHNYEVEDIQAIKVRLEAHGISLLTDIRTSADGSLELAVKDPDGNEIQFTEYSKEAKELLEIEGPYDKNPNSEKLIHYTTQVAYQIKDSHKMREFYIKGLGLEPVRTLTYHDLAKTLQANSLGQNKAMLQKIEELEDSPWIDFLKVGPHQYIELFHTPGQKKKAQPNRQTCYGYQHLCLEVSDIDLAWKAVIDNGLTPDTPIKIGADGSMQFWLVDPDGNRIELMAYMKDSKQLILSQDLQQKISMAGYCR